jgi:hypothetical protein
MVHRCIFYKPISKCHKLQHGQHACVHLASQLHNESTTFTRKNFNNHIRHSFIKPRLRIRILSTIVWYTNIHMNISLICSNLQLMCICIQPDTNMQNMSHRSINIIQYIYVKYTDMNTWIQNTCTIYYNLELWVLMWLRDLTTFKYKLQYLHNWFKLLIYLYANNLYTIYFHPNQYNLI